MVAPAVQLRGQHSWRSAGSFDIEEWLSPRAIFSLSGMLLPWLVGIGVVLSLSGLLIGLVDVSTPAATPVAKIGLIYVPAAWLATLLLLSAAFWALLGLVSERPLCFMMTQALAPTGGMFAFLALWSGALWNKGAHGVWWVGDAREIAELFLLGIYLAIVAVPAVIEDVRRADRWAAVVALFGASQVPFAFFLVEWLASISGGHDVVRHAVIYGGPGTAAMVMVAIGLWFHATLVGLLRLRCMIRERDAGLRRLV